MNVSPRFRDIFGSGPVRTRRTDDSAKAERAGAAVESDSANHAESVWLDITAAHRRAARTFTPESLKASDLWQG